MKNFYSFFFNYFFANASIPAINRSIKDIPKIPKNIGKENIEAIISNMPAIILSVIKEPIMPNANGINIKNGKTKNILYIIP